MRVKLVKNNLIHEYHLAETTVFSQFTTVYEGGGAITAEDFEKYATQREAVEFISEWTLTKLRLGWEIV